MSNAKNSEEKAKKAMVDAGRLADELRAEQDHSNSQGRTDSGFRKRKTFHIYCSCISYLICQYYAI